MTSTILRAGALTALLFGTSVASAQPPAPSAAHDHNHYRAKQVIGTKILIAGDTTVGTVDDLVFDDAGNLEYLIVENGGKLFTVPFEAAKFNVEKKMAVLSLTAEQYKVIPTYTATTYPSFYTPTYRTETYKYYGVTPRELRRPGPPVIVRP
ncbi:hypothetical protein FTUN_5983 [Frigoriglobus tundricola]|uniref:PRC-barrel domain-containing protein n=2 Tax=Frigoriglobus tundricola TaxID=2774151 RepID=A0A6M5YYT9_9BACT|nr:hypothetical protein FTUN_5983 [Frigoriglobus tundricola]